MRLTAKGTKQKAEFVCGVSHPGGEQTPVEMVYLVRFVTVSVTLGG